MKKMTKNKKIEIVKFLTEELNLSKIFILSNFIKLSVKEMENLRDRIKTKNAKLMVVKNNLIEKVFKNLNKEQLSEYLNGSSFIVWTREKNEIEIIKDLIDFRKKTGKIELKVGYVEGNVIDTEKFEIIGKIPSTKELEAKIVMLIKMPLARISNSLKYPLIKIINIVNQLTKEKGEKNEKSGEKNVG